MIVRGAWPLDLCFGGTGGSAPLTAMLSQRALIVLPTHCLPHIVALIAIGRSSFIVKCLGAMEWLVPLELEP